MNASGCAKALLRQFRLDAVVCMSPRLRSDCIVQRI